MELGESDELASLLRGLNETFGDPLFWGAISQLLTRHSLGKNLLRFMSFVSLPEDLRTGCWTWTGGKADGYGRFGIGGSRKNGGRIEAAHRIAYEWWVGKIPEGLVLDHVVCQNHSCVNPYHVEPVTNGENVRRGGAAAASTARALLRTHCKWGHPFDEKNTIYNNRGHCQCRACANARYLTRCRRDKT